MITRNPTEIAMCGCPYDPEYDEGSLGWHLPENHPEWRAATVKSRITYYVDTGNVWFECVGGVAAEHHFTVNQHFASNLTGPAHMLVCERCGIHLHAEFSVGDRQAS
jgi:hypothetical protein